jgi:tetratricopeptide (TPR) repeat protein
VVIAWVGGVPIRRTVGSSSYLSQDSHRVHIGLGAAEKIDRLEVRWLREKPGIWKGLEANHIWDITQGESEAKPFVPPAANSGETAAAHLDPTTVTQFWDKQHAAMDAMKGERNFPKAIWLFREALAINPAHEDSHYYLANCLAVSGDIHAAIVELDTLARINPQNHRAFQRKGELLAASASSRSQLELARQPLNAALRLNSEETGTLSLRAQVDLALGDYKAAESDLTHVCQANPRAVNAWFLRGYVAWLWQDTKQATVMLDAARRALGRDWKPRGSVLEGDVHQRMYSESAFLNVFVHEWDGSDDPKHAYEKLHVYLQAFRR